MAGAGVGVGGRITFLPATNNSPDNTIIRIFIRRIKKGGPHRVPICNRSTLLLQNNIKSRLTRSRSLL